jgi:predicted nucleotidyltransferase
MSTTGFDRNRIIELLTELGRRLSAKGVAGRLYIVGGAAMALEFDTRRTTRDIDAVLHPPTTVADEAASMARELGLPPGWLSAAASPFIPLFDEDPVSLDVEGLQVAVSSPANLLAMKMAAGRPQDLTDLVVLFRHLKIRSPEQAVDIATRMYGDDSVVLSEPRESLLLLAESVLARVHASKTR